MFIWSWFVMCIEQQYISYDGWISVFLTVWDFNSWTVVERANGSTLSEACYILGLTSGHFNDVCMFFMCRVFFKYSGLSVFGQELSCLSTIRLVLKPQGRKLTEICVFLLSTCGFMMLNFILTCCTELYICVEQTWLQYLHSDQGSLSSDGERHQIKTLSWNAFIPEADQLVFTLFNSS